MFARKIMGTFAAILLMSEIAVAGAVNGLGKGSMNYGVRFGVGVNTVISDTKRDIYSTFAGFGGGLSFDIAYGITDQFYLHSALGLDYRTYIAYGELGVPCGEDCGGYWEGYDVNSFLYLEIPVMAQWRTSALFVEAGPVFDIMLLSHESSYLPKRHRVERCYEDRRFGAGVSVSLGHVFSSGLFVDFRVTFQFTDLVNDDKERLTEDNSMSELWEENDEIHTRTIYSNEEYVGGSYYKLLKLQLGLGYWF